MIEEKHESLLGKRLAKESGLCSQDSHSSVLAQTTPSKKSMAQAVINNSPSTNMTSSTSNQMSLIAPTHAPGSLPRDRSNHLIDEGLGAVSQDGRTMNNLMGLKSTSSYFTVVGASDKGVANQQIGLDLNQ